MKKTTSEIASKVLGEKVDAPLNYDNTILVPIPRIGNREDYQITDNDFSLGYDIWNCYEVSFMTNKGLPVSGYSRIVYPSTSKNIVESKSLKLYLNSFNMTKFGENASETIKIAKQTIEKDLGDILESPGGVEFQWFGNSESFETKNALGTYSPLENIIDLDTLTFEHYEETPKLLEEQDDDTILKFKTNLLRSNCRVTNQPDWGTVLIEMAGDKIPSPEAIAKYLVSFRNESHFHEECVEMIFKRLTQNVEGLEYLNVTALYTRRGGIDICPVRCFKLNSSVDVNRDSLLTVEPGVLNKHTIQQ